MATGQRDQLEAALQHFFWFGAVSGQAGKGTGGEDLLRYLTSGSSVDEILEPRRIGRGRK
jgi:hypothetical protein